MQMNSIEFSCRHYTSALVQSELYESGEVRGFV